MKATTLYAHSALTNLLYISFLTAPDALFISLRILKEPTYLFPIFRFNTRDHAALFRMVKTENVRLSLTFSSSIAIRNTEFQ